MELARCQWKLFHCITRAGFPGYGLVLAKHISSLHKPLMPELLFLIRSFLIPFSNCLLGNAHNRVDIPYLSNKRPRSNNPLPSNKRLHSSNPHFPRISTNSLGQNNKTKYFYLHVLAESVYGHYLFF